MKEQPDTTIAGLGAGEPATRRTRIRWDWIGGLTVLAVAAGFVLLKRDEWPRIVDAGRDAEPPFLVMAAALQVVWLIVFGLTFWSGFRAVDVRLPLGRSIGTSWAANFLNMVVKSGGMSGLALFVRAATHRGYSGSRMTIGYLLTLTAGYAGFLLILALALVMLWLRGSLRRIELVASGGTFAFLCAMVVGIVVVVQSPARVRWTYNRIAGGANALAALVRRGPLLDPAGGDHAAAESDAVMQLIRERPARVAPVFAANLAKELCGVAVLYAVLLAFDRSASPSLAVIAYALTILFSYLSIVPSGLGLVEVSLTALLIRSGVPAAPAALTTIIYRLFEFWMPFVVGAIATRFPDRAPARLNASSPTGRRG